MPGLQRFRGRESRSLRQGPTEALVSSGAARERGRAAYLPVARTRPMSAARLLTVYRLVFSTLIVIASLQTLLAAHEQHGVVLLAGTEIAGALILCWRRTQAFGAALLLVVFASAQVMSAMQGEWPTRFLLYAASALLVVTMDRTLARSC